MAARARTRDRETSAKPASDAYVVMLAISLVAMIIGSVLLYLDWSQYDSSKPPALPVPGRSAAPPAGGPQTP